MALSEYLLAGVPLETPLVNAAGSINGTNPERILREVELLAGTAIGAITVGSITELEQPGNEAKYGSPDYYFDVERRTTYNSKGLPNIGRVAARKLMPEIIARAHDHGKPVIVSVSPVEPTPEIGDTYEQVVRLTYDMMLAGADLVEVNSSCPNVVASDGSRKPILGYDPEGMYRLVAEIAPWTGTLDSKVGVKLPPYMSDDEKGMVPALAKALRERRAFGFVTTANTIPHRVPLNKAGQPILSVPGGAGGMSGPSTWATGREQLLLWVEELQDDVDIVSTLGVDGGYEMSARRKLGAKAVGGVTFLWESADWGAAVTQMVSDWSHFEG